MKTKQFNSIGQTLNPTETVFTKHTRIQKVQYTNVKHWIKQCRQASSFIPMLQHQRPHVVTCGLVVLIVRAVTQRKLHVHNKPCQEQTENIYCLMLIHSRAFVNLNYIQPLLFSSISPRKMHISA